MGKSLLAGAGEAVKETVKGLGKKGRKAGKARIVNIVESIDVGAPIRIVYNMWTQFESFPGYMKKVENVDQEKDEKLTGRRRSSGPTGPGSRTSSSRSPTSGSSGGRRGPRATSTAR